MRSDKFFREESISSDSRSKKRKKKARNKTKRPPNYRRPTLLLHSLRAAPGKRIRKKACTLCKEKKWLNEFYITFKPDRGSSYKSECKKCSIERSHKRNNQLKKRRNLGGDPIYQAYQRDYYKKNKEKFLEYRRLFLIRHPEYFKKKSRERYARLKQARLDAHEALNDKDCS